MSQGNLGINNWIKSLRNLDFLENFLKYFLEEFVFMISKKIFGDIPFPWYFSKPFFSWILLGFVLFPCFLLGIFSAYFCFLLGLFFQPKGLQYPIFKVLSSYQPCEGNFLSLLVTIGILCVCIPQI